MSTSRRLASLATDQVRDTITAASVLCLPIGSHEQHGPHLPLDTDTIIAHRFTDRLLDAYGDRYDLWALPPIPYGLSPEHAWAPGTITLPAVVLLGWLDAVGGDHVRATGARTLLIVNGHGGNRSLLDIAIHDLRARHGINVCVIHPNSLAGSRDDTSRPEIHAGTRETSLMLTLAPDQVHLDRLPSQPDAAPGRDEQIRRQVLDRGTTWPWSSGDPAISDRGVMGGDPHHATAQLGERLISAALDRCPAILDQLTLNPTPGDPDAPDQRIR